MTQHDLPRLELNRDAEESRQILYSMTQQLEEVRRHSPRTTQETIEIYRKHFGEPLQNQLPPVVRAVSLSPTTYQEDNHSEQEQEEVEDDTICYCF